MTKVSIVVPTYNRQVLLRRAIDSLLAQSHADLEVIVVDDGSTDDTRSVVEQIDDPRVLYQWQEKGGACGARNRGMDVATGEFLGFLDSDDEYLPRKIERQVALLENGGVGLIAVDSGTFLIEGGDVRTLGRSIGAGGIEAFLRLQSQAGLTPTMLYRRTLLGDIRWDEALPAYQDYDFALRVLQRGDVMNLDEPLVRVHIHGSDQITHPRRHVDAIRALMSKHAEVIYADDGRAAAWHFRLARSHLAAGQNAEAAGEFRRAARFQSTVRRRLLAAAGFRRGALLPIAWRLHVAIGARLQRGKTTADQPTRS